MPGWRRLLHATHKPMLLGSDGTYLFCMTCGAYASYVETFELPNSRLGRQCCGSPGRSGSRSVAVRRLLEGKHPRTSELVGGGSVRALPEDWSENVGGDHDQGHAPDDRPQEVGVMDLAEKLMPGWRTLLHATHEPMLLGSSGDYLFCKTCGGYARYVDSIKTSNSRLAKQCCGPPGRSGDSYSCSLRRLLVGRHPRNSELVDGGVVRPLPHDWCENAGGAE